MLYPVDQEYSGMALRFQLAMPVSGWMKLNGDMKNWSLTSLLLKGRGHCEKSVVVLFSG